MFGFRKNSTLVSSLPVRKRRFPNDIKENEGKKLQNNPPFQTDEQFQNEPEVKTLKGLHKPIAIQPVKENAKFFAFENEDELDVEVVESYQIEKTTEDPFTTPKNSKFFLDGETFHTPTTLDAAINEYSPESPIKSIVPFSSLTACPQSTIPSLPLPNEDNVNEILENYNEQVTTLNTKIKHLFVEKLSSNLGLMQDEFKATVSEKSSHILQLRLKSSKIYPPPINR